MVAKTRTDSGYLHMKDEKIDRGLLYLGWFILGMYLFLAAGKAYGDNEISIEQTGDNLNLAVEQVGANNIIKMQSAYLREIINRLGNFTYIFPEGDYNYEMQKIPIYAKLKFDPPYKCWYNNQIEFQTGHNVTCCRTDYNLTEFVEQIII